jgi:hypothetical protein
MRKRGLTITESDGLGCPVLLCETCGRQVTMKDNVIWAGAQGHNKPDLVFVHKGVCDLKYDRGGQRTWWRPLDEFLKQLTYNTANPLGEKVA